MTNLAKDVVLGIPTTGNTHALLIAITAVLQGTRLPHRILIRSEGHFPGFAHYYMEQLADVARQRGVEFVFATVPPVGLRGSVDWLMTNAGSKLLWILADDVLPSPNALAGLLLGADLLDSAVPVSNWGYICGNKQDVNNRRGWPDYSQKTIEPFDFCPTYGNYTSGPRMVYRNRLLDNSHALFNLKEINSQVSRPRETLFPYGFQCGGDDTLFGLYLQHCKFTGWFCPYSQAFHLEKESQNFNEPTARAEAILRQAQLLGIELTPTDIESMFPYTKRYGQLVNK